MVSTSKKEMMRSWWCSLCEALKAEFAGTSPGRKLKYWMWWHHEITHHTSQGGGIWVFCVGCVFVLLVGVKGFSSKKPFFSLRVTKGANK